MSIFSHKSYIFFYGDPNLPQNQQINVFLYNCYRSHLVNASVSRQIRVSAAEYLHQYIIYGLTNQRAPSTDPNDPIADSDSSYWLLLFHVVFTLGADTDLVAIGICLNFLLADPAALPQPCLSIGALVCWLSNCRTI